MIQYNPKKELISIHIPKAGGTSFRKILTHWFHKNLFLHYYNEPTNKMPTKVVLKPGICIHGHFNTRRGFGIKHYYPEATQFITFLRDPFDILVSRYFYVKMREKEGNSFRGGKPTSLPKSINEFLEKEIRNPDYTPNILDFFPEPLTKRNYKDIIRSKYIIIGFMDCYQQSVDCIANLLGYESLVAPYDNKSERLGEVNSVLRHMFIENHPLEFEVYNYCREIFIPVIKNFHYAQ